MRILRPKHKHDWEYPFNYETGMVRSCRKCGEIQYWHEVHYGTWENNPPSVSAEKKEIAGTPRGDTNV